MSITAAPIVRFATAADFAQWLPLWQGYNAFYGRTGDTALPAAITECTWQRFFDPQEPMHALLAPICYLNDLYTVEAARGRGVGKALIEAVYAQARLAGSQRVYWQTHETNQTAMRLYDQVAERSGFLVYRRQV
jgi:GNAT superfamily N-acetyltransferase